MFVDGALSVGQRFQVFRLLHNQASSPVNVGLELVEISVSGFLPTPQHVLVERRKLLHILARGELLLKLGEQGLDLAKLKQGLVTP